MNDIIPIARYLRLIVIVLMLVWFLMTASLPGHEPLFGLGPHTMYQYGLGIESEIEKSEGQLINRVEILYGVTPDFSMTLGLPLVFQSVNHGERGSDIILRSKFRFFRNDLPGASVQMAVHFGVQTRPQNWWSRQGRIVSRSFLGSSFGYESRRHYFFAAARLVSGWQPASGSQFYRLLLDAAYGIRPWLMEYRKPDPVFLLELNTVQQIGGGHLSTSRSPDYALSPGLLFSYRNVMLKTGIKFYLKNERFLSVKHYEAVLGIEYHFPPFR